MMPRFFSIRDASPDDRTPWVMRILRGRSTPVRCEVCGVEQSWPEGDLDVLVDPRQATSWPDALGCGAWPLLIVSQPSIVAFREIGIELPVGKVRVTETERGGLSRPPWSYYWIDGRRLSLARLAFEKSGFIGVRFCPGCGRRTEDQEATYKKREMGQPVPYFILASTWDGSKVFTTNLSPCVYFCTVDVVDVIQHRRLTNFRVEEAIAYNGSD
jgi:hypothetical protein